MTATVHSTNRVTSSCNRRIRGLDVAVVVTVATVASFRLERLSRIQPKEVAMDNNPNRTAPRGCATLTRRSACALLVAGVAPTGVSVFAPSANAQSQTRKTEGVITMSQSAMDQGTVNEVIRGGGLLVVAQWEAKEGNADAVVAILRRFLPQAQSDQGVKLFLIGQGRENPGQFLFYELFVDEAALNAHLASEYFKTLIAGEALPLLAKRERAQYALL
jgi:quinol monooxygenase YgiN